GIIAEIELRLLPRPKGKISGIVFFSEESCLLDFVDYVRRCSLSSRNSDKGIINATLLEYFDERSLALISEKFPETPSGMAGAIFF
ncbi:hypothetical protein OFB92_33090, partial [Escherichia coli]|nr:hypothetical protein [Escherichia coli]